MTQGTQGHGVIINMSSYAPFIFTFNPTSLESEKKINYAIAPNIGGAYKKKYFSGFDAKEISFSLVVMDKEAPIGVMSELAYFEALREPDPGFLQGFSMSYGNQNFPPPQVIFWWGVSFIPLIWDVTDVKITETHFHSGMVRGVIGVPWRAEISVSLSLVEDSALNQANQIAKRAEMYAASAKSAITEKLYKSDRRRKEMPGLFKGKFKVDSRY